MAILSKRLTVQISFCYTVLDHVRRKTLESFKFSDTSASWKKRTGNQSAF